MPLRYTGAHKGQFDVHYGARGNIGEPITVVASQAAVKDNGLDAVLQKGSDKYDVGLLDGKVVIVRERDF